MRNKGMQLEAMLAAMLITMATIAVPVAVASENAKPIENEKIANSNVSCNSSNAGNATKLLGTEKDKVLDMAFNNTEVQKLQNQLKNEGLQQKSAEAYIVPVKAKDGTTVDVQVAKINFESSDGNTSKTIMFGRNPITGETVTKLSFRNLLSCVKCIALIAGVCFEACVVGGVLTFGAACIVCIVAAGFATDACSACWAGAPVLQNIGVYDTGIDHLNQSACRSCHLTSGTNISGGYNNTIGGVPTRHHSLLPRGVINPYTNAPFACTDCHPSTPGIGQGILLDRSCVNCHNGTDFYADTSLGAHVGNFSRPHHVNTLYASSNIGNPAANRTCNFCHGSFVNNYNDGHYKPSYATDFMITPFATFKATNFSQPDKLGGNKTWGGCLSCHDPDPNATPMAIDGNNDTHHKEILGFGRFGGQTSYQNASTPGAVCSWCHVIDYTNSTGLGSTFPLEFNTTNPFTGETLTNAMEVRNSTIEQADAAIGVFEPGTTNITINGTGCEKCHDVKSLHNIQYSYTQNGPQGLGHINNNTDCSGCHDSWLPANTFVPGVIIPTVDTVSPSVILAGTATTLTITGSNFQNGDYTSVVTVDGVTYTPSSITDSQITVDIPALTAGSHKLQLVKGVDTLSKLYILTVVPNPTITSAKLNLNSRIITITGTGFGTKPATDPAMYVSVNHAGNQITSTAIAGWSNAQIKAKNSAAALGDIVTVMTASSGEVQTVITS